MAKAAERKQTNDTENSPYRFTPDTVRRNLWRAMIGIIFFFIALQTIDYIYWLSN